MKKNFFTMVLLAIPLFSIFAPVTDVIANGTNAIKEKINTKTKFFIFILNGWKFKKIRWRQYEEKNGASLLKFFFSKVSPFCCKRMVIYIIYIFYYPI